VRPFTEGRPQVSSEAGCGQMAGKASLPPPAGLPLGGGDATRLADSGEVCPQASSGTTGLKQMARFIIDLLSFISYLLTIYVYVLIAAAVMSWLVAFNVVNARSPVVSSIGHFLYAVTEPVLRPIRNILPNLGGIDISPVIVILVIVFLQNVIIPNLQRALLP
jgi:YggT family protein